MIDALAVVPPMSRVIRFGSPAASQVRAAASTPAAGPDSRAKTGRVAASASGVRPPADCMISSGASAPRRPRPARIDRR